VVPHRLQIDLPDEAEVAVSVKRSCKAMQPARVINDRLQLHAGKQAGTTHGLVLHMGIV